MLLQLSEVTFEGMGVTWLHVVGWLRFKFARQHLPVAAMLRIALHRSCC